MSISSVPVWRIGVLAVMGLNIAVDVAVSLHDETVRVWSMRQRSWIFIVCALWLLVWFIGMVASFGRYNTALLICYGMFVTGLTCANVLRLVIAFDAEQPPWVNDFDITSSIDARKSYDVTRERWCAIAGGVFDTLVFVLSWRPRGSQSNVKLPLNAAPTHVRPVLGEIIFNVALSTILWGSIVIVRNDDVWDWCYMRDWMSSLFVQSYLCLYAACSSGIPATWSITQRLVAVFLWPVMGFMF